MINAPTTKRLSHYYEELALNRSTLRQDRIKSRKEQSKDICLNFDFNESYSVVHWDGKLMQEITGKETLYCFPIFVSFDGHFKLSSHKEELMLLLRPQINGELVTI